MIYKRSLDETPSADGSRIEKTIWSTGAQCSAHIVFEVTSFGTFVNFCKFCSRRWGDERLLDIHYMLKKAKSLRNAASHGACIMNGFAEDGNRCDDLPKQIQNSEMWLKLPKAKRKRWKRNPRMREIVTLFYLFSISVGEGEAKNKCCSELKSFYNNAQRKLYNIPKNNP